LKIGAFRQSQHLTFGVEIFLNLETGGDIGHKRRRRVSSHVWPSLDRVLAPQCLPQQQNRAIPHTFGTIVPPPSSLSQ
jgi:hypothetical protein